MTRVTRRQVYGVTIVDVSGRITLREGTLLLRDTVKDLIGEGHKYIVLNLADVTYVDSSGVGELIQAHMDLRKEGGEIKLLNVGKRVRDLLEITKLYGVFDVHEEEGSAIAAFTANGFSAFPNNQEHRISYRHECSVPLRFFIINNGRPHDTAAQSAEETVTDAPSGMFEAQAQNLSEQGVYFVCNQEVDVGQEVEMFFTIPGELTSRGPEDIRCKARIVRTKLLKGNRKLIGVGAAIPAALRGASSGHPRNSDVKVMQKRVVALSSDSNSFLISNAPA
jgi:anti-sigma B factor antagonist